MRSISPTCRRAPSGEEGWAVSRLFGIPVSTLAVVLVGILVVALGATAALALRNRVFLRLGIRNARRRPGRSTLIVVGLMLGTAIITAALATGDTMSQTIRSSAIAALGRTDEVVAPRGAGATLALPSGGATGARYFPQAYVDRVARASAGLVAGVAPVIVERVAVQDLSSRQNEPTVTLFASDPAKLSGFGDIRADGKTLSLADLGPHQIYLNAKAADKLDAKAGDRVRILVGDVVESTRVRAVGRYAGGATSGAGLLMPLTAAQQLLDKPGLIKGIFVANSGGVEQTDAVVARLLPVLDPLGLEADKTKHDALELADAEGSMFMSFFTTFGSFSIAAGILLIFLIFVMLAAERRGELGIARAVGTQRRHLVQMFLYEGAAYDLVAAAVGALVGVLVAYGMAIAMASAFAATSDFSITYAVEPASVVLAYAIGVLLTFAVVAVSASRVSRMNIVTAIRNLPEPPVERRGKRRWLRGTIGVLLGLALVVQAVGAKDGVVLGLGVALV